MNINGNKDVAMDELDWSDWSGESSAEDFSLGERWQGQPDTETPDD